MYIVGRSKENQGGELPRKRDEVERQMGPDHTGHQRLHEGFWISSLKAMKDIKECSQ